MTDKDVEMLNGLTEEEIMQAWDSALLVLEADARGRGCWSGAPVPIHGLKLILEQRYPMRFLDGLRVGESAFVDDNDDGDIGFTIRNSWKNYNNFKEYFIVEDNQTKKCRCYVLPISSGERLTHWISTLGASEAWKLETEEKAKEKLRSLIKKSSYVQYELTGTFLETSKRSGVTYLFRKLRPTVALRPTEKDTRILNVLCLHPIGHYESSWGGVMCPTDDVIAHLLFMRGDEHGFWKKANHHHPMSPQAGI